MNRLLSRLATYLLLGIAVAVPVIWGAYLFSRPAIGAPRVPGALGDSPGRAGSDAVVTVPDESAGRPVTLPLGTLYTNGPVTVDWNGVRVPVENAIYPYLGNETILPAPDGMGILHLGDGSALVACPKSKVRVSMADGTLRLEVLDGLSRYMFQAGTAFEVQTNGVILRPFGEVPASGEAQPMYVGEVGVLADGRVLIGGMLRDVGIAVARAGSVAGEQAPAGLARAGEITQVGETEDHAGARFESIPMPADVVAALSASTIDPADPKTLQYLCRIDEIAAYARIEGLAPTEAGAPPPVSPPVDPPVALAPPGLPETTATPLPPAAAGPPFPAPTGLPAVGPPGVSFPPAIFARPRVLIVSPS